MKVTITFPDEIAQRVCRMPDKDAFITKAVAVALAQEPEPSSRSGRSRWAQMVERIEQRAQTLGSYREIFDRDRKEFRESFRFDHHDIVLRQQGNSPFDVEPVSTRATTEDILEAIRESRERGG